MKKVFSQYLSICLVVALSILSFSPLGAVSAQSVGQSVSANHIFLYLAPDNDQSAAQMDEDNQTALYWTVSQNSRISSENMEERIKSRPEFKGWAEHVTFDWTYRKEGESEYQKLDSVTVSENETVYVLGKWEESGSPKEEGEAKETDNVSQNGMIIYLRNENDTETVDNLGIYWTVSVNSTISGNDVLELVKMDPIYKEWVKTVEFTDWKYQRQNSKEKEDRDEVFVSPNETLYVYGYWKEKEGSDPKDETVSHNTVSESDLAETGGKEDGKTQQTDSETGGQSSEKETQQPSKEETVVPVSTGEETAKSEGGTKTEAETKTEAGTKSEEETKTAQEKYYVITLDYNEGSAKKGSVSVNELEMKEGTVILKELSNRKIALKDTSERKFLGWAYEKGSIVKKGDKLEKNLKLTAVWAEVSYKNETAVTIQILGPKAKTPYKIDYKNVTKKEKKAKSINVRQGRKSKPIKLEKGDTYHFSVHYTSAAGKKTTAVLKYVNKPAKLKNFKIVKYGEDRVSFSLESMSKKVDGYEVQEMKKGQKKWITAVTLTEKNKYLYIKRTRAVKGTKYRVRTFYVNSKGKKVYGDYSDKAIVKK